MLAETAVLCLALNIYHEARGEPIEGQLAVALVTLNRAKQNHKTVCKVVYAPAQFSWTSQKSDHIPHNFKAFLRAKQVARKAFGFLDFTSGATHYHSVHVSPKWANGLQRVGRWGNHIFYRKHK